MILRPAGAFRESNRNPAMTTEPNPPPTEQQPMGAENHRVRSPLPADTQTRPGDEDPAAPITPAPDPDS